MESLSKKAALKIVISGVVTFMIGLIVIFYDLFNLYDKATANSLCNNGQLNDCNFGFNEITIRVGQALFILGLVTMFTGVILCSIKTNQNKH